MSNILYFMSDLKQKPSFRQKIANYFKFFCAGPQDSANETVMHEKQSTKRRSSIKNKRISFILDRALVKLSRKNLCAEQFSSPSATKELLETHIALRVKDDFFVIFQGKFSDKIMKNTLFSIKLIDEMPLAFSKKNQILIRPNQNFKLRNKMIETLVRQIQTNMIEEIELALKEYHGMINTFIFILYTPPEVSKLHELFIVFKDMYLFQVERVMVLQKCYANVIYISRFKENLLIDESALIQFYMDELIKKDSHIQRVDFPFMLSQLIKANLCVEVASTIGQIMVTQKYISQYDRQFIFLMHQRYPKSHQIIDKYFNTLKENNINTFKQHSNVPHFYQNTPLFGLDKEVDEDNDKETDMCDKVSVKQSHISFGMRGYAFSDN